ncbi:Zinc finger CCCH domain-containing protein 15 [Bagarius yarrelli]|uniref:Zinc finger CCCH domain-containing protein 15 n=1 Tax=Bagarius yarrelli TaxID=175774 RepID=A0A556V1F9_BAGYA|nr:Zinc finger CCCH domain-containing protein 15 [Bagarius yarrelli]
MLCCAAGRLSERPITIRQEISGGFDSAVLQNETLMNSPQSVLTVTFHPELLIQMNHTRLFSIMIQSDMADVLDVISNQRTSKSIKSFHTRVRAQLNEMNHSSDNYLIHYQAPLFLMLSYFPRDTMENWDEKKLEEVVNKKHGEAEKKKAKTQIVRSTPLWVLRYVFFGVFLCHGFFWVLICQVCKYFLEAIENNKYGWFWVCPAGGDGCMYRHALPVGFVLKRRRRRTSVRQTLPESESDTFEKRRRRKEELKLHQTSERAALGVNVTRITLETFLSWKKRKRQEKITKAQQDMERKKADFKAGKSLGVSGREVFEFRPELVNDDDEEADDTKYSKDDDDDDDELIQENGEDHTMEDEDGSGDSEGGGGEEEEEAESEAVPVDENLFTGEDLDELEEELNTLDLDDLFNLDADRPAVFSGPAGSYFGFSVDFFSPTDKLQNILVGAPKANTSSSSSVMERGAVYSCPWRAGGTCTQIQFDNTESRRVRWKQGVSYEGMDGSYGNVVCPVRNWACPTEIGRLTKELTTKYSNQMTTKSASAQYDDSYLDYVTGVPRGEKALGYVNIFNGKNMASTVNFTGLQMAAYFGNAVAATDINNDGRMDLLVGAPLLMERGSDGKLHVAVSAPYGGVSRQGLVYIYNGRANGPDSQPSQILEGKWASTLLPPSFGYAMHGAMDIDQNGYPAFLKPTKSCIALPEVTQRSQLLERYGQTLPSAFL